jgi:hypothetical protein
LGSVLPKIHGPSIPRARHALHCPNSTAISQ